MERRTLPWTAEAMNKTDCRHEPEGLDGDKYLEAARQYAPQDAVNVLFVAEAPPNAIERYFYFEDVQTSDWLWIGLMKCLYPAKWSATKLERKNKREWLARFQADRFQLIDAIKLPIAGTDRERIAQINGNADELIREIRTIKPKKIVLIKTTVYEALFDRLKAEGLPVVNQGPISFPSTGNQIEFHNACSKLRLQEHLQ
jgi:hypothetical protein